MKNNTRNAAYTKLYNKKKILSIIQRQAVSRAEIARQIGLTRAAVSIIVDEFISEGIVIVGGTKEAAKGRRPLLLDINPQSYYSIGLNISRDNCCCGIVNIKGELVSKTEIDIKDETSALDAIKYITEKIKQLCSRSSIDNDKILGMGITTPGPLDTINGIIINPPNFEMWQNIRIVSEFKKFFDFEILLNNNSSALALAEKDYGVCRDFSDFILLVIDTGVGSAIVRDNKLYRGFDGFGCELGHSSINSFGNRCNCGNFGCLELYASIPSILKYAKDEGHNFNSWDEIVNKAEKGDVYSLEIIDKEAKYLTTSIVNAINMFHIDSIVLTGYITYKSQMIVGIITEYVNQQTINRDSHKINIIIANIIEDSAVIAASTIIFDSLLFF